MVQYPTFDSRTHTVNALPPELIDGQWRVFWSEPTLLTDAELAQIQKYIDENKPKPSAHTQVDVSGAPPNVIG